MRFNIHHGLAFFISLLLIGLSPLVAPGLLLQADSLLGDKHQAEGLNCISCHQEDPPENRVRNSICVTCHRDEGKLTERTNKVIPNPHASPHLDPGTPLACDDCHHVHKPSKVSCIQCHLVFKFRNI